MRLLDFMLSSTHWLNTLWVSHKDHTTMLQDRCWLLHCVLHINQAHNASSMKSITWQCCKMGVGSKVVFYTQISSLWWAFNKSIMLQVNSSICWIWCYDLHSHQACDLFILTLHNYDIKVQYDIIPFQLVDPKTPWHGPFIFSQTLCWGNDNNTYLMHTHYWYLVGSWKYMLMWNYKKWLQIPKL